MTGIMNRALIRYPIYIILAMCTTTACILLSIIISHANKLDKEKGALCASPLPVKSVPIGGDDVKDDDEEEDLEEPIEIDDLVVKKNIAFNTIFNLEEFMIRLYKLGFHVVRIKSDGTRKDRFITIDQKGNICFHKLASVGQNDSAKRIPRPYIRLPISALKECFVCQDSPEPALILDFKDKLLHLAVSTKMDRDYIIKGIRLIAQRARRNSNFLLRSSSLLEDASTAGVEEYDDDDDDARSIITATTLNTSFYKR